MRHLIAGGATSGLMAELVEDHTRIRLFNNVAAHPEALTAEGVAQLGEAVRICPR